MHRLNPRLSGTKTFVVHNDEISLRVVQYYRVGLHTALKNDTVVRQIKRKTVFSRGSSIIHSILVLENLQSFSVRVEVEGPDELDAARRVCSGQELAVAVAVEQPAVAERRVHDAEFETRIERVSFVGEILSTEGRARIVPLGAGTDVGLGGEGKGLLWDGRGLEAYPDAGT